ncbi:MAG: response regulator transcription factor [Lachnospiraceae bacterium]|nr:response regulator transcription factor [Lachnospiraceae bacterium]
MYRILIVEDDFTIAQAVQSHLKSWNYVVEYVKDFQRVNLEFDSFRPDLVLMDIHLPFFNGFHWCSELRRTSNVPIIFLSSFSDNMNIVMAMNMGGDEFIEKPFDLPVLTAKIQALLRRTYTLNEQRQVLSYEALTLNLNNSTVLCEQEQIALTRNEFLILQLLLENCGKIVSRDALMTCLWGNDEFIDDNTLTVNVTRLRKKLEAASCGDYIKTKKGLGYLLG